jgi:hypothetical protein
MFAVVLILPEPTDYDPPTDLLTANEARLWVQAEGSRGGFQSGSENSC